MFYVGPAYRQGSGERASITASHPGKGETHAEPSFVAPTASLKRERDSDDEMDD